jgi:hypothetical protein
MKNFLYVILFFCTTATFSQTTTDFESIKLKSGSDYKEANKYALEASNYILSVPMKETLPRLNALQFLLKWMEGTPDFTFSLDATIMDKVVKGNDDLLGVYMACMTKYCIENELNSKDDNLVKLNSIQLILAYCENPTHEVKMPKQLKKLSEANKKGELEKELNK